MGKKPPPNQVAVDRIYQKEPEPGGCMPCLMMTSLYLAVPTAVVGLIVKWKRR